MISSESSPRHRIKLSDGREVPTTAGLRHTDEEIRAMKAARLGKSKSEAQVRTMSTVWERVRPLARRGGLNREIESVTGLTYEQVKNARDRKRQTEWSALSKAEGVELRELRRRSHSPGQAVKRSERSPLSEEQKTIISFAGALFKAGFFEDDLTYWEKMHGLYQRQGRELPDNFGMKLVVAAYFKSVLEAKRGDKKLFKRFSKVEQKIEGIPLSLQVQLVFIGTMFI